MKFLFMTIRSVSIKQINLGTYPLLYGIGAYLGFFYLTNFNQSQILLILLILNTYLSRYLGTKKNYPSLWWQLTYCMQV